MPPSKPSMIPLLTMRVGPPVELGDDSVALADEQAVVDDRDRADPVDVHGVRARHDPPLVGDEAAVHVAGEHRVAPRPQCVRACRR